MTAGIIYLVLGGLFLADRLGYLAMRASYVLPLILIGVGVSLLVTRTGPMTIWNRWARGNDSSERSDETDAQEWPERDVP